MKIKPVEIKYSKSNIITDMGTVAETTKLSESVIYDLVRAVNELIEEHNKPLEKEINLKQFSDEFKAKIERIKR